MVSRRGRPPEGRDRGVIRLRHRQGLVPRGIALGLGLCLLIGAGSVSARPPLGEAGFDGFRTLTGTDAREFQLPSDVRLVSRWRDAGANLDFERYQQYAPVSGAHVEGGQLTIGRRGDRMEIVVGAHYRLVAAINVVRLDGAAAATAALTARA